MAGLILKLRAHEQVLVNGVVIQNGERNARLIVKTPDVNILRLRDAIHPDEVDTPVKRVCYIAQLAVAGEVEPEDAAAQLGRGIPQLQDALAGLDGTTHLERAIAELRRRNFYGVLRALRNVLPIEEMLLRRGPEKHRPEMGAGGRRPAREHDGFKITQDILSGSDGDRPRPHLISQASEGHEPDAGVADVQRPDTRTPNPDVRHSSASNPNPPNPSCTNPPGTNPSGTNPSGTNTRSPHALPSRPTPVAACDAWDHDRDSEAGTERAS